MKEYNGAVLGIMAQLFEKDMPSRQWLRGHIKEEYRANNVCAQSKVDHKTCQAYQPKPKKKRKKKRS